jgi:Tol biopolymer transport system component
MPVSINSRLGRYEILSRIGAGGMGEVYRARDTKLGRDVAIKVLPEAFARDPERMARFEREAKLLAVLNHPNIAAIYGIEESESTDALVMELAEGPTLADRLTSGPIPVAEALPIARQMADALEYAHEHGVVHRDLKPSNIKISRDDAVKILDFGLAKAIQGEADVTDAGNSPTVTEIGTKAGVLLGTAAYMSPEQAKAKPVDRRADIYAFGCVLYEMLTGKRAFQADSVTETLAAVLQKEPDWSRLPSATPVHVRVLLHRCLQKDPKQRLRDIGDARISLDEVLSGKAETTSGAVMAQPLWRRALPWALLASALLGATAILSALLYWARRPQAAEPVRFEVPVPARSMFFYSFSLSPNGRQIAYRAPGPGGRNVIWIRALDSLEPHVLPGTEDVGMALFWSPDSRFVVFQTGGFQGGQGTKLEKGDVSGGPPQPICDTNYTVFGGAWNREGTIIFGSGNGISQVPAAGGIATLVTTTGGRNEAHVFPSFLPDGKHFVYSRWVENRGIFIGSLGVKPEQQSSRRVLATDSEAVYAPSAEAGSGRLLFVRDGNLLVQPFDKRRLDLVGDPVQLVPRVAILLGFGEFSASSTGVLAYQSSETGPGSSEPSWFDRKGKELGAAGDPGSYQYFDLGLSPDATRAAVTLIDLTSEKEAIEGMWLVDLVRGVSTRFTVDPPSGESPVWFPDGKRIAFTSVRTGGEGIYQRASNGAAGEQVLVPPTGDRMTADDWSGDGRFLLYAKVDPKTRCDLWVLPLASDGTRGGAPAPFANTGFNEDQGQFSPDTHWIAYVSDESGRFEVYVRPFPTPPGGGSKTQISRGGGMQPRWRRDGKELFYFSLDGKLMAVDATQGPTFKAGVPRLLFQSHITRNGWSSPLDSLAWGVAPDGKRFLNQYEQKYVLAHYSCAELGRRTEEEMSLAKRTTRF